MENSEKKFVFESIFQIQLLRQRTEKGEKLIQSLTNFEGDLPFLDLQVLEEVKQIVANPEEMIISRLNQNATGENEEGVVKLKTHLYGMPIDTRKAIELIDAPIKKFISYVREMDMEAVNDFLSVACETSEGIRVDPELIEKKIDRYRTYASTPHQKEFLEAYEKMVEAMNTMIKLGVPKEKFLHFPGRMYLNYSKSKKRIELNHQFYSIHC